MNEKIKNYVESKQFEHLIVAIAILAVMLLIFRVGIAVGYRKEGFACQYGDTYYRTFQQGARDQDRPGFFQDTPGTHGLSGTIVSVSLPTIVVEDTGNTERVIHIDADTVIRDGQNSLAPANLASGQTIIVIGEPDANAEVDARLIRIVPQAAPQSSAAQPTASPASPAMPAPSSITTNPLAPSTH